MMEYTTLFCRIRAYGSAAYNLCRIAQGSGDAYVEYGIHIWDFVAGMLIAEEAGAVVRDPTGKGHLELKDIPL